MTEALQERMDPRQVTAIRNDDCTEMNSIIFKHGGTINNIGDAVMAVFGHMYREDFAEKGPPLRPGPFSRD